jgi:hypothetical protein
MIPGSAVSVERIATHIVKMNVELAVTENITQTRKLASSTPI